MIAKAKDIQTELVERHFRAAFPAAEIEAYRYNPVSIRVRVVDDRFRGLSRLERHELIERQMEALPEDIQVDVTMAIPLTREELSQSLANFEFEHPSPSLVE